jgi:hypothetical protein
LSKKFKSIINISLEGFFPLDLKVSVETENTEVVLIIFWEFTNQIAIIQQYQVLTMVTRLVTFAYVIS